MQLEYFANLAEIVGVVLIVASLIYVAKQLRQNTNAIRAQSRQALLTASQAELFVQMENPDMLVCLIRPEELSLEEHVKVSSWLYSIFRARHFAWLQYRNGVIDEAQWETERAVIRQFLSSQRVRDWWAKLGRGGFGDEFADFLDEQVKDQPADERTFRAVANWTKESVHSTIGE